MVVVYPQKVDLNNCDRELKSKTIEGLAQEVGFDNRATFYRIFKDFMDTTPIQFIQANKSKEEILL